MPARRTLVDTGSGLIRYGGEEFLVLLPGAGTNDLAELGDRIRRAVGETSVLEGAEWPFTK